MSPEMLFLWEESILWQESIIEEMTPFSYPEDPDDWDSEAFENLIAQSSINQKTKTKEK